MADPLRHPQTFVKQADALIRQSIAVGGLDPVGQIDAHIEASFADALQKIMAPPTTRSGQHAMLEPVVTPMPPKTTVVNPASRGEVAEALSEMAPAGNPFLQYQIEATTAPFFGVVGNLPAVYGAQGPVMAVGGYAAPPVTGIPDAQAAAIAPSPPRPIGTSLGNELEALIHEMSGKFQVPDWLVRNVIRQESGGNPSATSPVGAQGLMQLMPSTASQLGVTDAYDPRQNVEGGVKYLKQLMQIFDGDLEKTVAAYNAGPGAVQKYGGVPPFSETRNYVKRVLG